MKNFGKGVQMQDALRRKIAMAEEAERARARQAMLMEQMQRRRTFFIDKTVADVLLMSDGVADEAISTSVDVLLSILQRLPDAADRWRRISGIVSGIFEEQAKQLSPPAILTHTDGSKEEIHPLESGTVSSPATDTETPVPALASGDTYR